MRSPLFSQSPAALNENETNSLRQIILEKTGILVPASKNFELQSKLITHLESLSIPERELFLDNLRKSDKYRETIINYITIGESYFFRNHPHFEALRHNIIPALIKKNSATRTLRIWSAGCSTGEEPYSLAMMFDTHFPELLTWNMSIRATDINTSFMARARKGVYTNWSFRGVPNEITKKYFSQTGKNQFAISDKIKERVRFEKFNLSALPFPEINQDERFDLIICRNVLIYFSSDLANDIIESFSNGLCDDGFLILGHSESFPTIAHLETVYSHATFYYRCNRSPEKQPGQMEKANRHCASMVPGIAGTSPPPRYSIPTPGYSNIAISSLAQTPSIRSDNTASVQTKDAGANALEKIIPELVEAEELSMMGDLDGADKLLDQLILSSERLNHRVYFLKAVVADQRNETQRSLANLKQAIFINRNFVIAHYYQGVIAERERDEKLAKRAYRNVVELTKKMRREKKVEDGGGITAQRLLEITTERLKELEF